MASMSSGLPGSPTGLGRHAASAPRPIRSCGEEPSRASPVGPAGIAVPMIGRYSSWLPWKRVARANHLTAVILNPGAACATDPTTGISVSGASPAPPGHHIRPVRRCAFSRDRENGPSPGLSSAGAAPSLSDSNPSRQIHHTGKNRQCPSGPHVKLRTCAER
jgi:hypothetical protein